jgi:GDP-L-fucose synthase
MARATTFTRELACDARAAAPLPRGGAANAAEVVIWGSGTPMREFLHVDDMAEASVHVLDLDRATYQANTEPMLSHINVGTGEDVSIAELAMVASLRGRPSRSSTPLNPARPMRPGTSNP